MKMTRAKDRGMMIAVLAYLLFYAFASESFLTVFPFVHSDEAWLAGLTRDMRAAGSFGVTESFFDLKPRVPHAIKLLYHALLMGYVEVFGYSIHSVRLLSLTAGLVCLWLLWLAGKELGGKWTGAALMVFVSLDLPFIYSSHFGRQEILLCISLTACILILLKCHGLPSARSSLLLAAVTGISIGIHPNSFLCAAVCGCVMLACAVREKIKKPALTCLLLYLCVTGAFAAVFVGISFLFDPHFFPNYFRYGEQEFELSRTATGRISQFFYFFKSIYGRENGTYYIPDLRLELVLLSLFTALLLFAWLILRNSGEEESEAWCGHTRVLLASMAGLTAGTVVIGRYNQTTVIFFVLLGWLIFAQLLLLFERPGRLLATGALLFLLPFNSYFQIAPFLDSPSYEEYLEQAGSFAPRDAAVLANLNTGFYFDQGMLYDYRNLPYLENPEDLEAYMEKNKIQYIFYPDELDYIYENRPYYNAVYGNAAFIRELKDYCATHCTLYGSFENPLYGPRLAELIGNPDYAGVQVYKVKTGTPAGSS